MLTAFSLAHPSGWAHAAPLAKPVVTSASPGGDALLVVDEATLCGLCLALSQVRCGVATHAAVRVASAVGTRPLGGAASGETGPSAPCLAGHPTRAPPGCD